MTRHPNPAARARIGLVLSGGGARAAYQVGVLKAIADILPDRSVSPFPIICGTSAGGLNATGLATHAACLRDGVNLLESVWLNFRTHHVYRTDWPGVLICAWKWLTTMAFGRSTLSNTPVSLLDNRPLRHLLTNHLELERIQDGIDNEVLQALCITASGYTSGASVSFFQGAQEIDTWRRSRRIGVRTDITVEHLMASAAIPIIFPPVRVNREYFGDGALRQIAPISPALHLGAEKVLVVGVGSHQDEPDARGKPVGYPSIAQVVSHIMNSSFIDGLEADIERLTRINRTISFIPEEVRGREVTLRPVEVMVISPPAERLDAVAMRHAERLPKSIRLFVRGSGATQKSGSGVLSYLLFEAEYCRDLMDLGYGDTMERREEMLKFLGVPAQRENLSNVVEFKKAD
jgi:NTE family protein